VVGEFISRASTRLGELAKKYPGDAKIVELLDVKCHVRLADIAHSLLKVSPYDPESMACRGLQRYMQCILPRAEWADDALRAALVTILRRLDKVFLKISKKPSIRVRSFDIVLAFILTNKFEIFSGTRIGKQLVVYLKVFMKRSFVIRMYCIGPKSKH